MPVFFFSPPPPPPPPHPPPLLAAPRPPPPPPRPTPYACVPPTVISLILIVGRPTPTGICCPSLPHIPTPRSSCRSLHTAVASLSDSGPLPRNVAPLTGAVTLPSSIK